MADDDDALIEAEIADPAKRVDFADQRTEQHPILDLQTVLARRRASKRTRTLRYPSVARGVEDGAD